LVETLGIEGISKSQASEMAESLDEEVAAFRARPLDAGPYPYLWLDALAIRVADGYREILGFDVFTQEIEAAWHAGSVADPHPLNIVAGEPR